MGKATIIELLTLAFGLAVIPGCGAGKKSDKGGAAAAGQAVEQDSGEQPGAGGAAGEGSIADQDFGKLVALGPSGLALKIRSALGIGLTGYKLGAADVDYITLNGPLFTGAISPDPTTIVPAKLASVNYFLALYGLADVVSKNYSARLLSGANVANDCRKQADAEKIVQVVFPPVEAADRQRIAGQIVESCNAGNITETITALVSSYTFPLDSSR